MLILEDKHSISYFPFLDILVISQLIINVPIF